jgi:hypothetical protein
MANFFLGSIDVDQTVELYDAPVNFSDAYPNTHYLITINANFHKLIGLTGNYVQNVNPNLVTTAMSLHSNDVYLKELLGYNAVYDANGVVVTNQVTGLVSGPDATGRKGTTTGVASSASNLGFRFLEIAAVQIFAHARARAAIRNDTQFSGAMQSAVDALSTQINQYLVTNVAQNEIFNDYVRQNLLASTNDVDTAVNFNFDAYSFNGYSTAVRINFTMNSILDSAGANVDYNLYGMTNDTDVNILLKFDHADDLV